MPAIAAQGLRKRYGDTLAVDEVTLEVEEGEIYGILGRNGAGKTTAVEIIAGLRRPDEGTVSVLGLDPWRDRARLRTVLGVQLQSTALHSSLTVREMVRLYRSFYREGADPEALIEQVGLTAKRDVRFENLSGGQAQRLSIALALAGSPRAVILDELTTGLDPEARRQMWAMLEDLRDGGVTIVLVSHQMEEVERLCDRLAVIDRGRVLAVDTPAGLIERADLDQVVRFRTAAAFDPAVLEPLDEVDAVAVGEEEIAVTGHGELLQAVATALVRADVVALDTRFQRAGLEDAFLALTGRPIDTDQEQ
ncbi:MAG TPA: ABC transporter ATP-binding protein [Glycomyces sp.]|nr:ABC transporter ATP-binding protein [Glycomyces sp.]